MKKLSATYWLTVNDIADDLAHLMDTVSLAILSVRSKIKDIYFIL